MKAGWETKRLGEVCEIVMGQSPDGESYNTTGEGLPLINGPVEFSQESFGKTIRSKFTTQPTKLCKEGDLILCVRGSTTGRMNIAGFDACIGRGVASIRAKQYQPWINHFIASIRDEIHGKGTGATFPNVSGAMLNGFEVTMPPIPEQQRIVGILDQAFNGIATAKANFEANLQNARALFESHLQSVFTQRGEGWVERKLGELSKINYGYTESACGEPVGPKFLRITDIQDNRVNWDTVPYCPITAADLPKYKLAEGDIVFARTGATTGKSYLITEPPDAVFASYLIRVQISSEVLLPPFLYLFFQTKSYWDSIKSGSSGSAQGGFNATKLGELVIPYPKLPKEQRGIIAHLDGLSAETQRLASLYQRKLAALDALKQSLLHQAFSGQL